MTTQDWLILASIGVAICTGIITALGSLMVWIVVRSFNQDKRLALVEQKIRLRVHKPDDSLEQTA